MHYLYVYNMYQRRSQGHLPAGVLQIATLTIFTLFQRCLKEMGASDSRRGLKKSSIRHRSTQFCECLPFRLQPYCTSNRHMHAFIENKLDIMIVDLTFKKRFLIKDVLDRTDQLQKERELPPDLTTCLVIGYHADLAVVQVFHHSGAKFYVCNCTTRICIYKYLPCPCPYSDKTFGLCEAYFTGNGQFLVLKGNDLYFALNNSRMQALYHSYIEVAKLDEVTITSAHYTFSSMGPVNFGISPDPEKNSDIYMSLWKYRNSTPILVTNTIDVSSLLNGKSVNQDCKKCNHNRLHALNHVTITDLPKFVNIQVPRNSDYIITSTVLRYSRSSFPRAFISCTYPITADLREKKNLDKVVRTWNYESYGGSLIQIDWPKLSPSGNYSYFGDQLCLLPSHSLKSLSRICLDLLTELVLPEDVHQLPTPEIFKCLLKGVPPLEMATQQNV